MDTEEFRVRGKEMVDYICKYMNTLPSRRVTPAVEPGYLRECMPTHAPVHPEPWDDVMQDIEKKIMPGVTHWQHHGFHAYFPSGNAYPSILGDMLSGGIGCVGFSWVSSPVCTELEIIMMDWMGKAIGLPSAFLSSGKKSNGGGVIQGSASDCVFVVMLAARAAAIKYLKKKHPTTDDGLLLSKLVAYASKEAHSCVEKAAMMSFVKLRVLPVDDNNSLRGITLKEAMEQDVEAGFFPFFVSTTLGTTSCCSFDNLPEIGPVAKKFPSVWLHVDAAYAGSSFLCPENKHHLAGVEYADSFNTNPNKMMLTAFDCSLLWVTNKYLLTSALIVDPVYLQHMYDHKVIDYRHWSIPLSRRFRSLKLWFMLRSYGISGLQKYVRLHCELAKYFEKLVRKDKRFEVCNKVMLGLVCFRLLGGPEDLPPIVDELNQKLLTNINASGHIHMIPTLLRKQFVIRFSLASQHATREDMDTAWEIIQDHASELLEGSENERTTRQSRTVLALRNSHFVRMVSDPKLYYSNINKDPPPQLYNHNFPPPVELTHPGTLSDPGSSVLSRSPAKSWISWPLGSFIQSADHDSNDVPSRLDTTSPCHDHGHGCGHGNTLASLHGQRCSSPSASPERRSQSPTTH
ncbi:aromatic-L-amino-acid decarboxylase-like [Leptidea sinapis]|uniref:aromatic-L-amino-acid decarboxylase-like n=1 Tax=Leptidea sinapis TaxID=189913 RepID=UPI0021C49BAA|nr:aromatic-L-amino-acid decarboxylase-like [Leptidea sinapis]